LEFSLTLVSDIIRDAYRESNLIAIGADPTSAEQTEGLTLLNRLVASVYGIKAGEDLEPLVIGRNNISRPQDFPGYETVPDETEWYVPANARLILNLEEAVTVYLDPNPDDGARFAFMDKSGNLSTYNLTINGNGRTIASATSVTVSTDSAIQEYFYRADTGDWALVSPLEADDTFPFPDEFEDMFVIGLAARINPRNGVAVDAQSGGTYSELLKQFKARYRQHRQVGLELGYLRLVGVRRGYSGSRGDNSEFNIGRPR
jgi:hypothetical protein